MSARICPKCGYAKSKVYDIRDQDTNIALRRRRCPKCDRKWQTVEIERWQYETLKEVEDMTKDAKFGKWVYYVNDEGKARWKCDQCGKICRRDPHDKHYCSNCGSKNTKEA